MVGGHRIASLGGFGFPAPNDRVRRHYDEQFVRITTLDITAGSVQAMCRGFLRARVSSLSEGVPGYLRIAGVDPISGYLSIPPTSQHESGVLAGSPFELDYIGEQLVAMSPPGQTSPIATSRPSDPGTEGRGRAFTRDS